MGRIEVISAADPTAPADGFERRRLLELESTRIGETRIAPRSASAWHRHPERTLVGFVVSGTVTFEFGPNGEERIEARRGSFFRIPPGVVHRDLNEHRTAVRIVNISIGEGPPTVDVVGPDPA